MEQEGEVTLPVILSTCCYAPTYTDWSRMDDPEHRSTWIACSACGQPCDATLSPPDGGSETMEAKS